MTPVTRGVLVVSLFAAMLLPGCGAGPGLASIQITPVTGATVFNNRGETAQFKAIGTFARGNRLPTTRDITKEVTWESSNPSVATINSSGLATAVGPGTTTITASMNSNGDVTTSTSSITAANTISGAASGHDLLSLTIIPGPNFQTVTTKGETAQFIAIGTFNSSPTTTDMTNLVSWQSSDVKVATINSAGLATANFGSNPSKTQITAIATSTSGATITGLSDLAVDLVTGDVRLPTLAIYKVGLGNGSVTGRSLTDPGDVITCGSGAVCTGNFILGSAVILTATWGAGSTFGGWSSNCTPLPTDPTDPPNLRRCSLSMSDNDSVGVIFNRQ